MFRPGNGGLALHPIRQSSPRNLTPSALRHLLAATGKSVIAKTPASRLVCLSIVLPGMHILLRRPPSPAADAVRGPDPSSHPGCMARAILETWPRRTGGTPWRVESIPARKSAHLGMPEKEKGCRP